MSQINAMHRLGAGVQKGHVPLDDQISQSVTAQFAHADTHFQSVSALDAAEVLAQASEVTLIVDADGVIRDAAIASDGLLAGGAKSWTGRKWLETVTAESEPKIVSILAEAQTLNPIKAREVNHSLPQGEDKPIRYTCVRLGDTGKLVAFGRDLSRMANMQQRLMNSQLSMEREFSRLRAEEMRYRTMFQLADVPQILVEAATLKVVDINPAAQRVLGMTERKATGGKLTQLFDSDETELLHKLLRASLEENGTRDITLKMRGGQQIAIHASRFHQDRNAHLLLRLESDSGNVIPLTYAVERHTLDLVENMPDAFVVTNDQRMILSCNSAFATLLGLSSAHAAEGELIDSWFERPGVDCNVLVANVQEHGLVRRFATVLRGPFGRTESVEISATLIDQHGAKLFGFLIRQASGPSFQKDGAENVVARTNEQITNLVGHMPLKDIVRETTGLIEHLCIETALELTKGNRVSAARMLGLSRQSLYAKLARDADGDDL